MADVVLCAPPILSICRPSLALGILAAALRARDISTSVIYANLNFAERYGAVFNEQMAESMPTHLLAGDWLFSHLLPVTPDSNVRAQHETWLASRAGAGFWQVMALAQAGAADFVADIAGRIVAERPRIVGFSTLFQQTTAALALAAAVKRAAPDTIVCIGGANCHGPMGAALLEQFSCLDYVFTGEADQCFPLFVESLLEGRDPPRQEGVLGHGGDPLLTARPVDIEAVMAPDHSDYFRALDHTTFDAAVSPAITFEASRGCWWGQKHHCTFCGLNSQGLVFRQKSADRVRDEIKTLAARHSVNRFCAADNILAMEHIDQLVGRFADEPGAFSFFYEIKSNLDETAVRKLAAGGVTWVQPGIESLDDRVLRLMRKGVGTLTNLRLLRLCREVGIGVIWNVLYGFPGEPADAYRRMAELVPLLEHLPPPSGISRIRIDRFSPNFEQAEQMGFDAVRPVEAYAAIYGFDEETLMRLAYFFDGVARNLPEGDYVSEVRERIMAWRRRWYETNDTPEMRMERIGPLTILKDTRCIATLPWRLLDDTEVAVIDALRDPVPLRATLAKLDAPLRGSPHREAFERMCQWNAFVVQGNAALSLVVDGARRIVSDSAKSDHPWGRLVMQEPIGTGEHLARAGTLP